tara:strand:+ start:1162 stop:1854 length:693 start_codon:yes stop_codon:yes gene_type:complete
MKKIVILSAGPGLPEIVQEYGHSSDWIPNILSDYDITFDIRKIYENDFGDINDVDSWIITGSKYSVYDNLEWIKLIKPFIKEIAATNKPILGICFGHQLLAEVLGGKVEKNPKGWELGSYNIELTDAGKENILFDGIDDNEVFYESHQDAVLELPNNSISLAKSMKSNQSFLYGDNVYGVQFHPEFSWNVTRKLMDIRINKGIKVDSDYLEKSTCGTKILHNFFRIIESR